MNVYRVKTGSILPLGKQGENLARKIQFDISRWISTFGPGTVQLLHQRSGDEAPYPVAVEQDGTQAIWTVTNADTAVPGTGHTELQYYVGDTLAKSETWMTKVFPALSDASDTPPEAQQGWVDQVLQAGAAAAEAADRAEEAAVRQPYPNAETGTWWVWNAESGAYEDTGISYGTGGSGGGVTDHEKLTGRDKADQHPMIAITGLEDALAGKQPTGSYITEETDPTVPAWAKAETKPSYTAAEVGADPSGTAASLVTAHNTEATAHSDMRLLIQGLTDRLNALADSDDTTLDQLSEIVAYIKSNRDMISSITTGKVSVADIVNDLVTNVADKPLSAAQGVALKALIDALDAAAVGAIPAPVTATVGQTIRVSSVDETGRPTEWEAVDFAIGGGEKPWTLIAAVDVTAEISAGIYDWTFTDLEYKELWFIYKNMVGTTTSTSGLHTSINGVQTYQFCVKTSSNNNKNGSNGWTYSFLCLGSFYAVSSQAANSPTNYALGNISANMNPVPINGDGFIHTLILSSNMQHKPASGYFEVYGR